MKLAVTWEMCGYVDVPADTLEEAMGKFNRESDYIKLPVDGDYVDGSFRLTTDDAEDMKDIVDFQSLKEYNNTIQKIYKKGIEI